MTIVDMVRGGGVLLFLLKFSSAWPYLGCMAVGGKMCGLHWGSKGRNVEQETSQTEPESQILSYFGQNHYEL